MLNKQKFPGQPDVAARCAAAAEAGRALLKVLLLLSHPVTFQETSLSLPESE